jgi:hypothetical protein
MLVERHLKFLKESFRRENRIPEHSPGGIQFDDCMDTYSSHFQVVSAYRPALFEFSVYSMIYSELFDAYRCFAK